MMKRVSVIVLLLFAAIGYAQETPFQAGIHFLVGTPQNELKDNVDNNGYGLSGYFGYNLPRTPLTLGANLGFMIYGSNTTKIPFNQWSQGAVDVEMTTTNSIMQGHLMLRAQAPTGKLRPYIDGLFGFNYFLTSTNIENEQGEELASSENYDDGTMSYGGGAGILYQFYEKPELQAGKYFAVSVDFGVRYIKGGNARYLKEGPIESDASGKPILDPSESHTDLMNYHLGVVFSF